MRPNELDQGRVVQVFSNLCPTRPGTCPPRLRSGSVPPGTASTSRCGCNRSDSTTARGPRRRHPGSFQRHRRSGHGRAGSRSRSRRKGRSPWSRRTSPKRTLSPCRPGVRYLSRMLCGVSVDEGRNRAEAGYGADGACMNLTLQPGIEGSTEMAICWSGRLIQRRTTISRYSSLLNMPEDYEASGPKT